MGKLLKLKDGTEYTATIGSNINAIQIPQDDFEGIDTVIKKLTKKNLATVEFDGHEYTDLVYDGVSAVSNSAGVMATFTFTLGVEDRITEEVQAAIDAYTLQLMEEGVL